MINFSRYLSNLTGLLLIFPSILFAFSITSNATFDIQNANKTLERLNNALSSKYVSTDYLLRSAKNLTTLREKAKERIKTLQASVDEINALQKEILPDKEEPANDLTETQKYLKDKKDTSSRQILECRLFMLRSGEVLSAINLRIQKISAKELLRIETSFWPKVNAGRTLFQEIQEKFDSNLFISKSGIKTLIPPIPLTILCTALFIVCFLNILLRKMLTKKIASISQKIFSQQLYSALLCSIKKYIFWITIPLLFFITTSTLDIINNQLTDLTSISSALFGYSVFLMFAHFSFYPFDPKKAISGISTTVAKPLLLRLKILAGLSLTGFLAYTVFQHQPLSESVTHFTRSIFITLLIISLINLLWLVNRIRVLKRHRSICLTISLFLTVTLSAMLIIEWLGYQHLVNYVLLGIFPTLLFGFTAYFIHRILKILLENFEKVKTPWSKKLRSHLGLENYEGILELFLFRIFLYLFIWGSFLLFLLKIWGLHETFFRTVIDIFLNGFSTAGFKIVPSRIILALLFLIFCLPSIRWIKTSFEKRKDTGVSKGARAAIAAIIGYAGYILIWIIALLIAGINLGGFAIVAGALSVGVGFGLKDIVNNFISGLILLIERPIRPGDRVMIGNIEGFVKKIRIRSTQIKTLEQTDFIVPNSEIILGHLTNLTFHDFYARVFIAIHVAYGSDTELVSKTLLEIARTHPKIITEDPVYAPSVFFTEFVENSLRFELYCVVPHVSNKYRILSDLHFTIEKTFRENNIKIAFPQQDIHIKDWPTLQKAQKTEM